MIEEKWNKYLLDAARISKEYNVGKYDVYGLTIYQDLKRTDRGEERDLEKSVKVVERWLRRTRR